MDDKIKITYRVDDGYAGGDRHRSVVFYIQDLEGFETETDMIQYIGAAVDEDMHQNVHSYWNTDQIKGLFDKLKERDAE